jgi:hypothetical protein
MKIISAEMVLKPLETRPLNTIKKVVRIGVKLQKFDAAFISSCCRDMINMVASLNTLQRLVICCEDQATIDSLKGPLESLRISFEIAPKDKNLCAVWKVYHDDVRESPDIQDLTGKDILYRRVTPLPRHKIRLIPDDPRYPDLFRQSDNRIVPPGLSPNINRVPPRVSNNNFPWSWIGAL